MATDNKLIFKAKLLNTTLDFDDFKEKLSYINSTSPEDLKTWVKETVPEFDEK
jgi:hypothetical protein